MRRRDEEITRRILKLVYRKPVGLTIEEVSRELKINRTTASRHLDVLELRRQVLVRELGQSKLHYPKTRRVESWLR